MFVGCLNTEKKKKKIAKLLCRVHISSFLSDTQRRYLALTKRLVGEPSVHGTQRRPRHSILVSFWCWTSLSAQTLHRICPSVWCHHQEHQPHGAGQEGLLCDSFTSWGSEAPAGASPRGSVVPAGASPQQEPQLPCLLHQELLHHGLQQPARDSGAILGPFWQKSAVSSLKRLLWDKL